MNALLSAGSTAVSIVSSLMAASLILYSGYALYDTVYTNQSAFSSWDLMQYRPTIEEGEPGFEELQAINEDLRGWLTVYDTHIDYPVVQGENDLEYANKDVYGNSSLTGAIYLATANEPDGSDPYNLIYGHHMDNGAMFGDLDKFADGDFFAQHREGVFLTPQGVYDLTIFAAVQTDAYEDTIYNVGAKRSGDLSALKAYIAAHAVQLDEAGLAGATKIVALSTCASAETNGRLVVFAQMTAHAPCPTTRRMTRTIRRSSRPIPRPTTRARRTRPTSPTGPTVPSA